MAETIKDFMRNPTGTMSLMHEWFWSERLWLPVGYTWKDFESTTTIQKAELKDLQILPLLVIALFIIRYIFENFIARPFCLYLGIKTKSPFQDNRACERLYSQGITYPNISEVNELRNEAKLTTQQINSWFRRRRNLHKTSLMGKAMESCWRCLIYTILFLYGSYVLLRTNWIWNHSQLYVGYIHEHQFTSELKRYYFLEITLYISLFISQFFDTKRKDACQQFVHHAATLILLFGSYILSLYRFGAVICYLHDAADAWLEAAKVANYAKIQKVCDVLFAIFAFVFFVTRLIYYPIWVAYSYFNYNVYTNSVIHKTLVTLCFVLLFLHFYWGFLIGRMVYRLAVAGNVSKDTRSDTEESETEK